MLEKMKRTILFLSIFSLVLGAILILYPAATSTMICYIIAAFAIVYGCIHLFVYYKNRIMFTVRFELVQGILGVAVGLYIFMFPHIILKVIPVILGFVVVFDSIMKLQSAYDLWKIGYPKWWSVLITALIGMVLGLLMIFYPFETTNAIVIFIGFSLFANGVCDLVYLYVITKKLEKFQESLEIIPVEVHEYEED